MTSHISIPFVAAVDHRKTSASREKWKGAPRIVQMQIYENYVAWMNSFLVSSSLFLALVLSVSFYFGNSFFLHLHWRIADDAAVGKTFMDQEKSCLSLIHPRCSGPQASGEKRKSISVFLCLNVHSSTLLFSFLTMTTTTTKMNIIWAREHWYLLFSPATKTNEKKIIYDSEYVCPFVCVDFLFSIWCRIYEDGVGFSSHSLHWR